MHRSIVLLIVAQLISMHVHAQAPLSANSQIHFATAAEARALLTTRDDFVERMSPFDRAARLKTDQDVTEQQYLDFVGAQARDWSDAERQKIERAIAAIQPRLAEFNLPLPKQIDLVRTTGQEEGGAFYTRGGAIMFPTRRLARDDEARLRKTFCHELFHVLSRHAPELREKLYAAIGYEPCGEVPFPAELADRKLTNPDAPRNDHAIKLKIEEVEHWAVPILYARTPRYDVNRGGEFFDYLEFRFLVVDRDESGAATPVTENGQPLLAQPAEVGNLFEQIGRNTQYIIHPEEVLADNFAMLILNEPNPPSPEILLKLEKVLRDHAATTNPPPASPAASPARNSDSK